MNTRPRITARLVLSVMLAAFLVSVGAGDASAAITGPPTGYTTTSPYGTAAAGWSATRASVTGCLDTTAGGNVGFSVTGAAAPSGLSFTRWTSHYQYSDGTDGGWGSTNSTTAFSAAQVCTTKPKVNGGWVIVTWGWARATATAGVPDGFSPMVSVLINDAGTPPAITASTCDGTTGHPYPWQNVSTTSTGTVIGIRFTWNKAAELLPTAGWTVTTANSLTGPDVVTLGTVPTTDVAPTTNPGWKGYDWANSGAPSVLRIRSQSTPSCWLSVLVLTHDPLSVPAPNTGVDANGDDCGLNPLCYITQAGQDLFIPKTENVDNVYSLGADLGAVVPWGYLVTSLDQVGNVLTAAEDADHSGGLARPLVFDVKPDFMAGGHASTDHIEILADGSTGMELLTTIRPVLAAVIWVLVMWGIGWILFWTIIPGTGGKQ